MISKETLEAIKDFFGDADIDSEWLMRHVSVDLEDSSKTIRVSIDNMNYQEYGWIKETI